MDWPIFIAIIMFLGLVFLFLEIFVVPGFGPVGIIAVALLVIGTYLSWTKLSPVWGTGVAMASIFLVVISFIILQKSGAAKKFVLGGSIGDKSSPGIQNRSKNEKYNRSDIAVGETGLTMSDLRPSGIAEFQDKRVNVIADGIYIKRNTTVRIVRIEGNRIFVEEV
jgi:membrane-bound serine protease (ClpP class)